EYFGYSKKAIVNHLVYPIPSAKKTGLGIHITLDLAGKMKFGPNDYYINTRDDYKIDKRNLNDFHNSAQKLLPNLKKDDFYPDMAGIRPKLQGPSDEVKDFIIKEEFPGFINLIGIESPGLTSALAIADYVDNLLK
ncbi:MAG: FAD-dependent oxidoreductase, partial [Candidatus Margulisbacteria bacterium]|nr:FAD-dependent oxidoreductase [Candidatus Margulisiibacteriota bacterium]